MGIKKKVDESNVIVGVQNGMKTVETDHSIKQAFGQETNKWKALHGGWSEMKQQNNIKTYGWWVKSSTTISWILVKPEQQRSIARKSIKHAILISLYWLRKMNQSFSMTMFCRWVQKLNKMVCKITSPNLLTWLLFDSLTLFQASQQFHVLKRKNKKPLKLSENFVDSKNPEF